MKKFLFTAMFAMLLLTLAACGGDNSSEAKGEASSGNEVELVAKNWEFAEESYTVPAGDVTISLKNEEGYHGITIDGTDVKIDGEGKATAKLEPGEYTVKCNIPCGEGHGEMSTKLIVE
ncbi:cytochrome C oxidase subunit II [Thalassobacillus pellis]|uniref:cytochrome C oxidase subunit II n=1 Tax=Thalassobacillus pellis TaxID=748008 RepID=UPI0019608280|nr:cytochrome C oxidase subunit II [Thalassobacillus pellis]MBM7553675.1 cytochrome c oxidase subunit 2 [Thalassobacillus pellis]